MVNFLKNYISTCLFIMGAAIIYGNSDFHRNFFSWNLSLNFLDFSFPIINILYIVMYMYFFALIPYYIYYKSPSKARIVFWYFWKIIQWNNQIEEKEKTALLAWVVKIFFAPLMIVWVSKHIFDIINNLYLVSQNINLVSKDFLLFFNSYFFWTAFSLILFIDVVFFTLWYLLEAPFLKNTIKSVEPTLIWWAVAILCYPPFNTHVSNLIWWFSTDFPQFENIWIHISLNICILILMALYSWASLALGLKASNLTNRWIVTSGPYKYIRHPAYICKNLAWLLGGIPMIYLSSQNPDIPTVSVLIWLFWWAFVYYLRAMTEEIHLSMDPDYREYKKRVPYKFIPKVW